MVHDQILLSRMVRCVYSLYFQICSVYDKRISISDVNSRTLGVASSGVINALIRIGLDAIWANPFCWWKVPNNADYSRWDSADEIVMDITSSTNWKWGDNISVKPSLWRLLFYYYDWSYLPCWWSTCDTSNRGVRNIHFMKPTDNILYSRPLPWVIVHAIYSYLSTCFYLFQ